MKKNVLKALANVVSTNLVRISFLISYFTMISKYYI